MAQFDDRLLAHMRSVIIMKLRREEKFVLNWEADGTRFTLWLHSALELQFRIGGAISTGLNRDWIEVMNRAANSADGLFPIPEPEPRTGQRKSLENA